MSGMWLLLVSLFLQLYLDRAVLEAEDARVEQPTALVTALTNPDIRVQRHAIRAIGRLERSELADSIRPFLVSSSAGVRMEAINALGQMNASFDAAALLQAEPDAAVRSVIYETAGRLREHASGVESLLVNG